MSLFVLASKDGWVDIMYDGLDAVGVDQQVRWWGRFFLASGHSAWAGYRVYPGPRGSEDHAAAYCGLCLQTCNHFFFLKIFFSPQMMGEQLKIVKCGMKSLRD